MDKRTFIVELVKAVAWPASMLLIFWIMKDNIRKLFSSIRKLKHGDTEFAFEETLSEAKSEAEQAGLPASQIPEDADLLSLAESHPNLAIIEAWQRIEGLLRAFLPIEERRNSRIPTFLVIRRLRENGHIPASLYYLIRQLKDLRNKAVHSGDFGVGSITNKSAYEYVETASIVKRQLEALGNITVASKPPVSGMD